MLPLDVYLQNEDSLVMGTTTGEVVDELKGTHGEKLLRSDPEARVVVNFHGVSHSLLMYQPIVCRFSHPSRTQVTWLKAGVHPPIDQSPACLVLTS